MTASRRSDGADYQTNIRVRNLRKHILIEFLLNKLIYLDQIMFPEIPLNDYQH
jgi:hypothetical protein